MSARTAKAARRAQLSRFANEPVAREPVVDEAAVIAQFKADGGREIPVPRDPAIIRARLGGPTWGPPERAGHGWRFQRVDSTLLVLVSASCWPDLPDTPIVHASISRHRPVTIPTYDDLQLLHRAVWLEGNAMQAFVPAGDHVNIRANVLHLWGRADGARLWPIDFGRYGSI